MAENTEPSRENVQAYFRCPKGFLDVLRQDALEEQPNIRIEQVLDQGVIVSGAPCDIASFIYMNQAIEKAVLILDIQAYAGPVSELPAEISPVKETPQLREALPLLLPRAFTFRVDVVADPHVTQGYWRAEQAISLSGILARMFADQGLPANVSLKDAEVTFIGVFDQGKLVLGIDLAGFDLSKRSYKITSTGVSIKGTIAYCLVRRLSLIASPSLMPAESLKMTSRDHNAIFLDPSCGTGEVCIEAALYASRKSPWTYQKDGFAWRRLPLFARCGKEWLEELEKRQAQGQQEQAMRFIVRCVSPHFGHLSIARKHAKIAGVEHLMQFSRIEYKWLDAKFAKGEVDAVATYLAPLRSGLSAQQKEKEAKSLFYQLEYLMRKEAKIILMTHDPGPVEAGAAQYGFRKIREESAFMGLKSVVVQTYLNETMKKAGKAEKADEPDKPA